MQSIMKKILIFLLFLAFVGITVFVGFKLLPQAVNFAGLQVVADGSEVDVYLDSQKLGKSPYENEKLHPGDYSLKLVPVDSSLKSWSRKITLSQGAMTTVERSFSKNGESDGGLVVYLQAIDDKMSKVEVQSTPDEASLFFDKESKGNTPFTVNDVIAGSHEVILKKNGYQDKIYKVDSVSGYKIFMDFDLIPEVASASPSAVQKTLGATTATMSGSISTTPNVSVTPTKIPAATGKIQIIDTGTGWLRVHIDPTVTASESAKVNTGDKFTPIEEQNGWIKIEYSPGQFGWVSSEYVKKI
jgi:hypothetical protein